MSNILEDIKRATKLIKELSGPSVSTGLLSGGAGPGAIRFFAHDPYNNFGGMRVFTDANMVIQFRRPRTKRRRIQNKWKKNKANFKPSKHALVDQQRGNIYCHPVMYEEIKRQIPRAR